MLLIALAWALIGIAPRPSRGQTTQPTPTAATTILPQLNCSIDGPCLVGRPVLFTVTIANTTKDSITFISYDNSGYPDSLHFAAAVWQANQQPTSVDAENGAKDHGDGGINVIAPGSSMQTPLAIAPLPAGEYSLAVGAEPSDNDAFPAINGAPITFKVVDDPAAIPKWDQAVLDGVRKDNWFDYYLMREYNVQVAINGLVADLGSTDANAVAIAANMLPSPNPDDSKAFLEKPVENAIAATLKRRTHWEVLEPLISLAHYNLTDAMLDALLSIAHTDFGPGVSDGYATAAVYELRLFPQKRVIDALHQLQTDKNPDLREAATNVLRNPIPLPD